MRKMLKMLAIASASLALPALAQQVEIKTGRNGQLSGSAKAGDISTSIDTGTMSGVRTGDGRDRAYSYAGPCTPGTRSRSVRVVSPGGSSSSSVSVSGGGTVAVGGGGSPGSRVYEGGCPDDRGTIMSGRTTPHYVGSSVSAHPVAVRHKRVVHRRVVHRHQR